MKKLLGLIGAFAFSVTPAVSVIACGTSTEITTLRNLSLDLTVTNLGKLDVKTATIEDVIKSTLTKNPNLNAKELEIVFEKDSTNEAKITVKAGSKVYSPAEEYVIFTDQDHPILHLKNVLKNINLGYIGSEPTNDSLKEIIIQKNPNLAEFKDVIDVSIISKTDHTASVGVKTGSSNVLIGDSAIVVTYDSKLMLETIMDQTNLNNFTTIPTIDDIWQRIKELNKKIQDSFKDKEIQLEYNQEAGLNEAKLVAKEDSTKFEGAVDLVFTDPKHEKLTLDNVIKTTHLGHYDKGKANINQLVTRTQDLNVNLDLNGVIPTLSDVLTNEVHFAVDTNAGIYAERDTPKVVVYTDVENPKLNLQNALKVTNLGRINVQEANKEDITKQIVKLNHHIKAEEIEVITIPGMHTEAIVRVRDGSNWYHNDTEMTVIFTTTGHPLLNLSNVIKETKLGKINTDNNMNIENDIKAALAAKNPLLDINRINVSFDTGNVYEVTPKLGNGLYDPEGKIKITINNPEVAL